MSAPDRHVDDGPLDEAPDQVATNSAPAAATTHTDATARAATAGGRPTWLLHPWWRTDQPPTRRMPRGVRPGGDTSTLLRASLRSFGRIGAIAPTGPRLARLACAHIPGTQPATVVELGAGTGAITDTLHLVAHVTGSRVLAVEADPDLVGHLACSRPWLGADLLHGDAADLDALLAARGVGREGVDVVVCSLPWTLFGDARQRRILHQVHDCLRPGGMFSTVVTLSAAALPAARRFRRNLAHLLGPTHVDGPVWANLPAALLLCSHRQ